MTKYWPHYGDRQLVSAPKKLVGYWRMPPPFSLEKLTILKKKFAQIGPTNQKLQLFEILNNFCYLEKSQYLLLRFFSK